MSYLAKRARHEMKQSVNKARSGSTFIKQNLLPRFLFKGEQYYPHSPVPVPIPRSTLRVGTEASTDEDLYFPSLKLDSKPSGPEPKPLGSGSRSTAGIIGSAKSKSTVGSLPRSRSESDISRLFITPDSGLTASELTLLATKPELKRTIPVALPVTKRQIRDTSPPRPPVKATTTSDVVKAATEEPLFKPPETKPTVTSHARGGIRPKRKTSKKK